jgi:hypothetical protein
MTLRWTQHRTEMSTRNIPGCRGRPTREAHNLTATCEPTMYNMWQRQWRLAVLSASTACYGIVLLVLHFAALRKPIVDPSSGSSKFRSHFPPRFCASRRPWFNFWHHAGVLRTTRLAAGRDWPHTYRRSPPPVTCGRATPC